MLDPPPPVEWYHSKTGYAEFHKMKWLSRQGALVSLAYKERLFEFNQRKSVEAAIAQLQLSSSSNNNHQQQTSNEDVLTRSNLRAKRVVLNSLRKANLIQSDLKSCGKNLQKILRSLSALQNTHPRGSAEYLFVEALLSRPWACTDVTLGLKKDSGMMTARSAAAEPMMMMMRI